MKFLSWSFRRFYAIGLLAILLGLAILGFTKATEIGANFINRQADELRADFDASSKYTSEEVGL